MRIFKYLTIIVAVTLTSVGCEKNINYDHLNGTKWKLVGIVDVQSGKTTKLEPTECRDCYTLTFDTDYTAVVRSIQSTFKIDLLNLNPDVDIVDMLKIEFYKGEGYNEGDTFCRAIIRTASYTNENAELKLFDSEQTKYLLFKPK
jgi:hypothetical protein